MRSLSQFLNESLTKVPTSYLAKRDDKDDEKIIGKYIIPVIWDHHWGANIREDFKDIFERVYKKFHCKFIPDFDEKSPIAFYIDYLRSASSAYFGNENGWSHNRDLENQLLIIDTTPEYWGEFLKSQEGKRDEKEACEWWVEYRFADSSEYILKDSKYPVQLTTPNKELEAALKKFKIKYEIL